MFYRICVFNLLFTLVFPAHSSNWLFVNENLSVNLDSFLFLENPKRVTFEIQSPLEPKYSYLFPPSARFIRVSFGIKCRSGKQYISRASAYDDNGNYIQNIDFKLNVDEDLAPGLTFDIYKKYCLSN